MEQVYEKLLKCYESYKEKISFQPEVALVLGSGLGQLLKVIKDALFLDILEVFL
jgi:purine-nucleoside phosphorylase